MACRQGLSIDGKANIHGAFETYATEARSPGIVFITF